MGRLLLDLQSNLMDQRKEVEQNQESNEKLFTNFAKDVARNISLLQDQSLLILGQQNACASQEQLREKSINTTSKDNEGQGLETAPPTTTAPGTTTESTIAPPTITTTIASITRAPIPSYSSCRKVPSNVSGVYLISVNNDSAPFNVYCEQEKFAGGWIVIQHRFDGSVDFYQNWEQYRDGFGELESEFWLGLEHIHQLTTTRKHELIVEIKDFRGNYGYARYSLFAIGNEKDQYHLKTLGLYKGTAGDALGCSRVKKFSTKDRDNDWSTERHWAVHNEGAWWYGPNGSSSNLNGRYMDGFNEKSNWWNYYKNFYLGLSFTRMMIRELPE
ncbi:microfibril-associated glycoprotein 4-like [Anopheles albimanus]|uniref:microfibril-associated glycoprotein 4-like n=1 Tax=Anopheles albimanus TaxID=7167 RepID=UPI001640EFB1|nr:microfibril-associated glycoprotein 4-like [Anopheles albimanus]